VAGPWRLLDRDRKVNRRGSEREKEKERKKKGKGKGNEKRR